MMELSEQPYMYVYIVGGCTGYAVKSATSVAQHMAGRLQDVKQSNVCSAQTVPVAALQPALHVSSAAGNLAQAEPLGCTAVNQYTLPGDFTCRTCPLNSHPFDTKDGCLCSGGYIPVAGTQSRLGNLQCSPCPGGTYAREGDFACTPCFERSVSRDAAGECIKCGVHSAGFGKVFYAEVVVSHDKTRCYCSMQLLEYANSYDISCWTSPNEAATWNAACSCTYAPKPLNGEITV
jgi:hypothetical protein